MVAASRFITIANPGKDTIVSFRTNRMIIFVCIRIYGFLLLIPDNIGVSILV